MIPLENGAFKHPNDPGEPTTGCPRISVTTQEAELLGALVAGLRVLEIGTGLGVSTRALAATAVEVITYDIDEWVHDNIWPDLPSNVTCVAAVDDVGSVDAVFVDGDHTTPGVKADMAICKRVAPDGLWIAHDTGAAHVRAGLEPGFLFISTAHGVGVRWGDR